jgi:hypothetical protein
MKKKRKKLTLLLVLCSALMTACSLKDWGEGKRRANVWISNESYSPANSPLLETNATEADREYEAIDRPNEVFTNNQSEDENPQQHNPLTSHRAAEQADAKGRATPGPPVLSPPTLDLGAEPSQRVLFRIKKTWKGADLQGFVDLFAFHNAAAASTEGQKIFAQTNQNEWKNLRRDILDPLILWRQKCTQDFDGGASCILYPFGGPDVVYATLLFPQATEYILTGLESVGSFEKGKELLKKDEGLGLFQKSLANFFQRGFFVTSSMAKQLSNSKNLGVLSLLVAQLLWLDCQVEEIQEGVVALPSISAHYLSCVRIKFTEKGTNKKITYIKCPLENENSEGLQLLAGFIKHKRFSSFIKSASYALHNIKTFSFIRSFLLSNSQTILQDDTGIPFRILKTQGRLTLFGQYSFPLLKIFRPLYNQDDLKEAFLKAAPEPLPFHLGYGSKTVTSHLILFTPNRS